MLKHDMDQCVPCGPSVLDRERFLYLWRHRLGSLRAMNAVAQVLDSARMGAVAREWVVEARAHLVAEREEQVAELAVLRASLAAVSLLLKRACEVEGIPLATIAHGILPSVHHLADSEGFPWRAHWEGPSATGRAGIVPRLAYPRFYTRLYGDAAIVRPQTHPQGGWGVKQIGGVLLQSMEIGGCRVMSTSNGRGVIDSRSATPPSERRDVLRN